MKSRSVNSESRRLPDGRYVYCPAKGDPIVIIPGEDASEEFIIMLDQFDHDEALEWRYESRQRCRTIEAGKRMTNDANDDFSADPIDNIVDKSADIFRQVFPEMKPSKKLIQKLQVYMGKLTNQQRDFIYDFFGLQMTVEDIARRDGVSHQAVTNRKNKILKRLKAMFEADGLL